MLYIDVINKCYNYIIIIISILYISIYFVVTYNIYNLYFHYFWSHYTAVHWTIDVIGCDFVALCRILHSVRSEKILDCS